jgi:D-apiose dehydrogenase
LHEVRLHPTNSESHGGDLMSGKLRGVGIGAGYFAPFQYEAWSRIPEVEITAVCDLSEAKARATASRFGVRRHYCDWMHMLDHEQPDFVDIITPPETHEEICAYAADHGIDIICQKPLAPTLDISRRIVQNASAAGVRFMVHENWRWQPWYRIIKKISSDDTIGTFTHLHFLTRLGDGWGQHPYSPRQPFFRDYPQLLVYETGVHFIDTFRFLLGEVTNVFAQLRRLNPAVRGEDSGVLLLNFSSGATALWDANRYNEGETDNPRLTFGELRIDATRGHLTMDTDSNLHIKLLGEPARPVPYERSKTNFAGDCVYFLQRHFVDCMLSGNKFESNGDDYLKTIRIVQAVYDSAKTNSVVTLI